MPGASYFGWGSLPDPEMVANSGPEVTYPTPPNTNSTPKSIASVAGGTAIPDLDTAIPDLDIDDGELTTQHFAADTSPPASNENPAATSSGTNFAAAQANGFASGGNVTDFAPTSETQTTSSGGAYAFGEPALTPKSATAPTFARQDAVQSPPVNSTTQSSAMIQDHGFAPPASTPSVAADSLPATTPGFTLPTDSPSFANLAPASSEVSEETDQPATTNSSIADFSTANRSPGFSTSITDQVLPPADMGTDTESGYSPGSTASGLSYPSDQSQPTTSGSYFR